MMTTKRNLTLLLAALLLVFGLFAGSCGTADPAAAQGNPGGVCSNATLSGNYGAFERGTFIAVPEESPLPPAPFPYALVGVATFASGTITAYGPASLGGTQIPEITYTGTYTVSADCTVTGTVTSSMGVSFGFEGPITGSGMQQEIHTIDTNAPFVGAGTFKKIPETACSVATLKGPYGVFGQGTDVSGPPPAPGFDPPFPGAHAGILVADGVGKMSGKDTDDVAGMALPTTFDIAYTVSSDCVVTLTITDTIEMPNGTTMSTTIDESGVITGEGNSQEVHSIITDPGWVFVDTLKKQ